MNPTDGMFKNFLDAPLRSILSLYKHSSTQALS
jgi:hypothetical protein